MLNRNQKPSIASVNNDEKKENSLSYAHRNSACHSAHDRARPACEISVASLYGNKRNSEKKNILFSLSRLPWWVSGVSLSFPGE